jgi:ketosteroid isomerase-like protein
MPWTPLVLTVLFAAGPQVFQGDPTNQFREMAKSLAAAYLRGDRAFVDNLLADDWTSTDYLGRPWTKARVLAMFDGPRPPMTKSEIDVDNVRLFGEVAVVTGRSLSAGRVDGKDVAVTQRFIDIYARRNGRWQIVASQGTEVK